MRNFASSKALRLGCALAFTLILFGAVFWAVINNHAGDVINEPYDTLIKWEQRSGGS